MSPAKKSGLGDQGREVMIAILDMIMAEAAGRKEHSAAFLLTAVEVFATAVFYVLDFPREMQAEALTVMTQKITAGVDRARIEQLKKQSPEV